MRLEISCLLVNFASCLQRMRAFCCHAWCALMCYHPTTTVLLTSHGQTGIFKTRCSMVPVTNSGGQQRRLGGPGPNIEPSPTSMLLFELAALPLPKVSWSNEPQKRKKVLSPHLHLLQFVLQTKLFLSRRQPTIHLSVGHVMVKFKIQMMQGINSSIRRHSLRQTPLGFVYQPGLQRDKHNFHSFQSCTSCSICFWSQATWALGGNQMLCPASTNPGECTNHASSSLILWDKETCTMGRCNDLSQRIRCMHLSASWRFAFGLSLCTSCFCTWNMEYF